MSRNLIEKYRIYRFNRILCQDCYTERKAIDSCNKFPTHAKISDILTMIMIEGWRWAFARSWTQLRRLGAMMVLLLMLKRIGQM